MPKPTIQAAYDHLTRGALAEAEAMCRSLLTLSQGRDSQAWTVLGMIMRQHGKLVESEAAYRAAIAQAPNNVIAHHNLGALLSQLERAEEALSELERASALGLTARELQINRGRALMQLYRTAEAEAAYAQAMALDPRDPMAQSTLAQIRHMRGDRDFARDMAHAARANPEHFPLQLAYGDLLRRAGDLAAAEGHLRALASRSAGAPEIRGALAGVLHEAGRLKEAEIEALEAAQARPHDAGLIEALVGIELALGRAREAVPFIRAQRERQPDEQRWIAYEATAARLLGEPAYSQLYDYERFVRVYDLEPPPGFSSMEQFNAALTQTLRKRHIFATHPLDQSLRNGSQTARSLVTEREPLIQALLAAFTGPLDRYCAELGTQEGHPLSRRNRGRIALQGCWSVELRRNGYHVNHVHPQGWISSAYYVSVPAEAEDPVQKSGWIKFGEPGMPVPGASAAHYVQPRAGRLVLFPSYMWHGTNAIQGDEPRLTVAFDAIPIPAAGMPGPNS
ncbi:MAG TPA: putative 2OG-Fe(II) oxygenase [Steroidobacteraceae bacterium]|nr:putative 2OG-Fe(II) oxygenase [Steroidobacteraceae bacterium]